MTPRQRLDEATRPIINSVFPFSDDKYSDYVYEVNYRGFPLSIKAWFYKRLDSGILEKTEHLYILPEKQREEIEPLIAEIKKIEGKYSVDY